MFQHPVEVGRRKRFQNGFTVGIVALMLPAALAVGYATSQQLSDAPISHLVNNLSVKSTHNRFHVASQIGKASWYGPHFQGKKTANGESFDMYALTCAHRTLPLGTWIRVTNLRNRRSVFVRVNDRGPVPEDRVVDLSYRAAKAVGIAGIGKVKLEPVRRGDHEMARQLVAQLQIPLMPVIGTGVVQ